MTPFNSDISVFSAISEIFHHVYQYNLIYTNLAERIGHIQKKSALIWITCRVLVNLLLSTMIIHSPTGDCGLQWPRRSLSTINSFMLPQLELAEYFKQVLPMSSSVSSEQIHRVSRIDKVDHFQRYCPLCNCCLSDG